jgi:hypothetical protein
VKHFRFNVRCEDGRAMRHQAFHDDPHFEMDIGCCEDCQGFGCFPERDRPCMACNGEGGCNEYGRCEECNGSGAEWVIPQPMTLGDLEEMCGDDAR